METDALKARAYLGLGEIQKTKALQTTGDNPAVKASAYTHVIRFVCCVLTENAFAA